MVTLLGRNGAGKTTTLRSIMGIVPPRQGTITFEGINICGQKPHAIASLGVGYVPEERMIFASLTVLENLSLPSKGKGGGLWDLEKIYQYFPVLRERADQKGSRLSGGEQQMLAIARILTMDLKLMLLDEPRRGWPLCWFGRSAPSLRKSERQASPSFWWSKTPGLPRESPISTASSTMGESFMKEATRSSRPMKKCRKDI